jgi:hypothetical protein
MNPQTPRRCSPDEMRELPRTPERKLSEISAFSPWDSPSDRRASIQVNRDRQSPLRKLATFGNLRYSIQEYTPTREPFISARKSPAPAASITVSPTYTSPPSSKSASTIECSKTESQSQPADGPQPPDQHDHDHDHEHEHEYEHEAWRKCENLARILDELEQFIDDYPCGLLQLDSPVVLQIRDSHSLDELHLNRLGKIFPNTNQIHLSALAAILIAQSYLANLRPIHKQVPEPRQRPPISKHCQSAATSNVCPNQTSSKAMTTVGIRLENVTSTRDRAKALEERARGVEGALHAVVQKIMIVVCGKFDELVWRTLMCLVETVEVWW